MRSKRFFTLLTACAVLSAGCTVPQVFGGAFAVTAATVAESTDDGFAYSVQSDGAAVMITGYTGSDTDLVIPAEIDGKPVVEIVSYAFARGVQFKSVVIPDSVTKIGSFVFGGCTALTSVTVGAGAAEGITGYVFSGCEALEEINVAESNPVYRSTDGVLFGDGGETLVYYPPAKADTGFTVPDGVTALGDAAFNGSKKLTELTLPESLKTIGSGAFSNCSSLTSLTIPAGVTGYLSGYSFSGCTALTGVQVADGNTSYVDQDGILFSARSTELLFYPKTRTDAAFEIPARVRIIGSGAFSNCTALTAVTIPDGAISIHSNAFSGCSGLTSVTIPASVTSIDPSAFSECPALVIHGYTGSEAERFASENQIAFESLGELQTTTQESITTTLTTTVTTYASTESTDTTTSTEPTTTTGTTTETTTTATETTTTTTTTESTTETTTTTTETSTESSTESTAPETPQYDFNGDGTATVADAILLSRYLAEDAAVSAEIKTPALADINGDGVITVRDVAALFRMITAAAK